jgi:hypothetical protein
MIIDPILQVFAPNPPVFADMDCWKLVPSDKLINILFLQSESFGNFLHSKQAVLSVADFDVRQRPIEIMAADAEGGRIVKHVNTVQDNDQVKVEDDLEEFLFDL